MKVTADLHIHSRYSRATSPRLSPPHLERWARIKGIGLLGAGDCTHPLWLEELRRSVDDAEEGFYTLKEGERAAFDAGPALIEGLPAPAAAGGPETRTPRFVLTGEIATIYKKAGKVRKVHHLVILPDFRAAAAFNARLEGMGGNILSDGRPILGMDSRELLALLLEADERAMLIPAHIWTPWFSALGAKSGFDSVEECYGDLAGRIPAVETGLSSNPPMNWALKSLDRFSIVSNSDAHSPDKLGREATIIDMELSYSSLRGALSPASPALLGTVEFFPQEGKYHYDGHRKCEVCLEPEAAAAANYLCPVCGKALTRGVMGRVLELADRPVNEGEPCPADYLGTNRRPYHSLIPLREIAAELLGTGAASQKAGLAYFRLIEKAGSEFSILMDMGRAELEKIDVPDISAELLAGAIMKMRAGDVFVKPGYDGEYGTIRVSGRLSGARGAGRGTASGTGGTKGGEDLFGDVPAEDSREPGLLPVEGGAGNRRAPRPVSMIKRETKGEASPAPVKGPGTVIMDRDQEEAVSYNGKETIIIAGPGTGKTSALTARVGRLISGGAEPGSILALTFTVKAAAELRERIDRLCMDSRPHSGMASDAAPRAAVAAATFHSFCCSVLRENHAAAGLPADFAILGEEGRDSLLREIAGKRARRLGVYIEGRKRYFLLPGEDSPKFPGAGNAAASLLPPPDERGIPPADAEMEALYGEYRQALKRAGALDFEDLCAGTVRLLASSPGILGFYRSKFRHIFVDEYQDINFSQYILIRLLASGGDGPSLWVIGDPNQAIYGFRGSDRRFIDRFPRDYPGAGCFALSRSFRCAEPIISAAGKLAGTSLTGNTGLPAGAGSPAKAEVSLYRTHYATEKSEAEGIARIIENLIGGTSFFALDSGSAGLSASIDGGIGPGDCAVLVRAAALAGPIVKALKDHGIPCDAPFEGPWWKKEPAAALLDILREKGKTLPARGHDSRIKGLTGEGLIREARKELAARQKSNRKEKDYSESVEKLAGLAGLFESLDALLDALDASAASGIPDVMQSDSVKVMTMHASKGLEFEHVFAAGLEEGIVPFTLFGGHGEGGDGRAQAERVEEERRLLYVAMTRARQGLWLSYSGSRLYRGRLLKNGPSRFLAGLEEIIPFAPAAKPRKWDGQLDLFK